MQTVLRFSCLLGIAMSAPATLATNVGGVYGPVINPTDSSMQVRAAFSPQQHGGRDLLVSRIHYQRAVSESLRWRVIGQVRDVTGSYEYDSAGVELLWQFQHRQQGSWDSAIRVDFRARNGDRPESVAVNWTNQWRLSKKWRVTALASSSWQVDGRSRETGTFFETRARLAYQTDSDMTVGLDSFNRFGKIGDFPSYNQQGHQLGPTLSGKAMGLSYLVGYLAGISDGARDDVFRLWVGKSF